MLSSSRRQRSHVCTPGATRRALGEGGLWGKGFGVVRERQEAQKCAVGGIVCEMDGRGVR